MVFWELSLWHRIGNTLFSWCLDSIACNVMSAIIITSSPFIKQALTLPGIGGRSSQEMRHLYDFMYTVTQYLRP